MLRVNPAEPGGLMRRRFALPFFDGWLLVGIAFVTMAVGVNARTAFSLLFPPILDEFGGDAAVPAEFVEDRRKQQRERGAGIDADGHRHKGDADQQPAVEERQGEAAAHQATRFSGVYPQHSKLPQWPTRCAVWRRDRGGSIPSQGIGALARRAYRGGDDGSAAAASRQSPRDDRPLRHVLAWIDAPHVAAPDPAGIVPGLDPAPRPLAFEQLADDPGLGPGDQRRGRVGARVQAAHRAADDDVAPAPHHLFVAPAEGSLPVAHLAPMLEGGHDFDRHVLAGQHPFDRILLAGAGPQVDLVGAQAGKTRKVAGAFRLGGRRRRREGDHSRQPGNPGRGPDAAPPGHSPPRALAFAYGRARPAVKRAGPTLLNYTAFAAAPAPQVGQSGSLAIRIR